MPATRSTPLSVFERSVSDGSGCERRWCAGPGRRWRVCGGVGDRVLEVDRFAGAKGGVPRVRAVGGTRGREDGGVESCRDETLWLGGAACGGGGRRRGPLGAPRHEGGHGGGGASCDPGKQPR